MVLTVQEQFNHPVKTKILLADDSRATHKLVISRDNHEQVLAHVKRDDIEEVRQYWAEVITNASIRVIPHNAQLEGVKLRSTDVQWVVNDNGELGVKIGEQFFFLHRGESLSPQDPEVDGTALTYRLVGKREFGEVIESPLEKEAFLDVGEWSFIDHSRAAEQVVQYSE